MNELIAPVVVERAMLFISVAGPLVGLIIGSILGARERRLWIRMVTGALIGFLGTAVCGMWHVYAAITAALGLDSLANLGLQIAMFAVLGALLGVAAYTVSVIMKRLGASE